MNTQGSFTSSPAKKWPVIILDWEGEGLSSFGQRAGDRLSTGMRLEVEKGAYVGWGLGQLTGGGPRRAARTAEMSQGGRGGEEDSSRWS